jgi:hypothetical protein
MAHDWQMRLNMLQEKEPSWKEANVLLMFCGLKCSLPTKIQKQNCVGTARKNLDTVNCKKVRLSTILQKNRLFAILQKKRLPAIFAKKLQKVYFAIIHPSNAVTARTKYLHTLNMMQTA